MTVKKKPPTIYYGLNKNMLVCNAAFLKEIIVIWFPIIASESSSIHVLIVTLIKFVNTMQTS